MNNMERLDVDSELQIKKISGENAVSIKRISGDKTLKMGQISQGGIIDAPAYAGPYEATPTQSAQTFSTQNKAMAQDFVVNPIPSNYGLITWDGSVLTVS